MRPSRDEQSGNEPDRARTGAAEAARERRAPRERRAGREREIAVEQQAARERDEAWDTLEERQWWARHGFRRVYASAGGNWRVVMGCGLVLAAIRVLMRGRGMEPVGMWFAGLGIVLLGWAWHRRRDGKSDEFE